MLADELSGLDDWSLEDVAAIEKIAQCAFEGAHIVVSEPTAVLDHFLAAPPETFSAVATAVFKKLAATFSFQGWLTESGFTFALVTPTSAKANAANRSRWVLSLADIRRMSLEPTTLLAENLVDAKIFTIAGAHYARVMKLRGLEVSAVARGGGGSTIVPELEEIVTRSDRVCFAITDSDQAWPEAGKSLVAKRCDKLVEQASAPAGHDCIPVRELENLVPPSVLLDLATSPSRVDAARAFQALCGHFPEVRQCGDIKEGTAGSRVFRLPEAAPERHFLAALMARTKGADSRCLRNDDCANERNQVPCQCVCVPKVGAVADGFHNWLNGRSHHKALEAFAGPWNEAWLAIGAMVLSWCCSRAMMHS